jgi:hypothetical protein
MMKLKIQFGPETRFDQPIRRMARTWVQWSPGNRLSLRTLAMAGRLKSIKLELTSGIFLENSSP